MAALPLKSKLGVKTRKRLYGRRKRFVSSNEREGIEKKRVKCTSATKKRKDTFENVPELSVVLHLDLCLMGFSSI
jgi:hypothetical protein